MRRITTLTATAALVVALTACGGGDGDRDGIATIDGGATATTDDGGGGGGGGGPRNDTEFQDALLEFAECIRDHGIDMPDPEFNDGGGVVIVGQAGGSGGPPSDAEQEAMEAADESCQPILEDARASLPAPSPEEQQEMQDRALEFAECMRDHGIDMPDPQFNGEGGFEIGIGVAGGEDGEDGPRRGPAGLDPEDPAFQEAQEACGDLFGGGGGPVTQSNSAAGDQ